jgi:hypothetical protein
MGYYIKNKRGTGVVLRSGQGVVDHWDLRAAADLRRRGELAVLLACLWVLGAVLPAVVAVEVLSGWVRVAALVALAAHALAMSLRCMLRAGRAFAQADSYLG